MTKATNHPPPKSTQKPHPDPAPKPASHPPPKHATPKATPKPPPKSTKPSKAPSKANQNQVGCKDKLVKLFSSCGPNAKSKKSAPPSTSASKAVVQSSKIHPVTVSSSWFKPPEKKNSGKKHSDKKPPLRTPSQPTKSGKGSHEKEHVGFLARITSSIASFASSVSHIGQLLVDRRPEGVPEGDPGDELMRVFWFVRYLMMWTGRWPFYHEKSKGFYVFTWEWRRWQMLVFDFVGYGGFIFMFALLVNVTDIMFVQRRKPHDMTEGEIIRQAMLERHTQFLIHLLLYMTLICYWTGLLIYRRKWWLTLLNDIWHYTAQTKVDFTKITNREVYPFCAAYLLTMLNLLAVGLGAPSPQSIAAPFVTTVVTFHPFISADTFSGNRSSEHYFPFTSRYWAMTFFGVVEIFMIMLIAHAPLCMYMWSMAIFKCAWHSWNSRMHACVCQGEKNATVKNRTTYELMYKDGNKLMAMTVQMDEVWSLLYESYLLFITVLLCFENGFTMKVAMEHDHNLTQLDFGFRFMRPGDFRLSMVLAPLNLIILALLIYPACWATDAAGSGYDIMRRKAYINGLETNPQVQFCTSMLQLYSSPRKIGFQFGRYVEVSRSNFLILCSLVFSSSIVVFQLNLQNDMKTRNYPEANIILNRFFVELEHQRFNHGVFEWTKMQ